jgi:hypothetical protein
VVAVVEKVEKKARGGLGSLVAALCLSREGPGVLRQLLRSLGRGERHEQLQAVVMDRMVKEIFRNGSVPHRAAAAHLYLLYPELERASGAVLVALADLCLAELRREGSATGYRGLALLGRLLQAVAGRESLAPDPELGPVTGAAYRARLLQDLCRLDWGEERVPALCTMFQEVRLEEAELETVFGKFCSSLSGLPAPALPPLLHHLLLLSKASPRMAAMLLRRVTHLFGTKLTMADRENVTNPDLNSVDMIESADRAVEELQQAEGTVVYHIAQQVRTGHPIAKEVLKLVKAGVSSPNIILNPFSLFLALALTSDRQLQAPLLTSLRLAISCCFALEERRRESAWLREAVPRLPDVSDLLTQIIGQAGQAGGWDLIGPGLVELGLGLLDQQPGPGRPAGARRLGSLHRLGARILLKVVRRQGGAASGQVLGPLTARILDSRTMPQYTEALRCGTRSTVNHLSKRANK